MNWTHVPSLPRALLAVIALVVGATAGSAYIRDYQYQRFKCDFHGYDHKIIFKGLVISATCVTVIDIDKEHSNGTSTTTD